MAEKSTVGVIVSRGYNGGGGGFTFDSNSLLFTNYQYDPEYVWTGEVYLRQEIADGRARLTANVFYSDYQDAQLSYDLTPLDPTDFSFIVRNAEQVETYGAEIGGAWLPVRGLQLYANAGVLHAKVAKYPGSGFQGNELPFAPSFTASAGIVYSGEHWDASLSTRYASSYYSDIENNPRGNVDPYFVANMQVGYTMGNVRMYGFVNNLLDSDKAIAIYQGAVPEEDGASVLTPRSFWFGVQMSY
jgi:outer membrane receptor protein involved in Fe transport